MSVQTYSTRSSLRFGGRRVHPVLRRVGFFVRALMMVCLLSALIAVTPEERPATRLNLLLISIDTCRADHLGCYGYDLDTSPHLDQLAREGVLFENATAAAPWTLPSHMSLFTSLYPSVHAVQTIRDQLGEGVGTLAECLAQNGYVTAGFVSGPTLSHRFGFARGFRHYDDASAGGHQWVHYHVTSPTVTNLATKWLQSHYRDNFFLFVHYFDCHFPYKPPEDFARKFGVEYTISTSGAAADPDVDPKLLDLSPTDTKRAMAFYDGGIAFVDEHVGKILQLLQDLRLSEKTLVIVLGDHGEGFMEHGKVLHGNSVYEEAIHVPLIMRLPGVIPAGKRIAGNVSHVDLMPTALGLLQVREPPQTQGLDLSPTILGDEPVPERLVFSELAADGFYLRAVRWGDHKLLGTTGKLQGAELEQVVGNREKLIAGADLKKDCPEVALQAFTKGPPPIPKAGAAKTAELDAELIQRLKSLGYTQ